MKIVQIEDFFHPDAGYQVNILSKYFVKKGNEVVILCAEMDKIPNELTSFFGKDNIKEKDEKYENEYNVKIIRIPVRRYISSRVIYDNKIFKIVNSLKPDVLFVHGNDTMIGMQYIKRAKKTPFAVISDSHMLSMASKNKLAKLFRLFYKHFITPIIIKYQIPIIRTQNDDYVEKFLGIPLELSPWISYGSDILLFHQDLTMKIKLRNEYCIKTNDFVAVFAGKLVESKGAMLLADTFLKKFETNREVILLAIGNTAGEYGQMVENVFEKSENRVIRLETQKYCDLAKFYQMSDIAVFAKQCSLSFYDVQACGLPVVSEANNINVDRCSHNNGLCFTPGSIDDFRNKIEFFANMSDEVFNEYVKNSVSFILRDYNYDKKADEYLSIIYSAKEKGENKK